MIAKNLVMILMLVFLSVGVMFNGAGVVLAQDNSGPGSVDDDSDEDNSDGIDNDDENEADEDEENEDDDSDNRIRDRIRERIRDAEREFERRIELPDGREIRIKKKVEFEDGKVKIKIERKFTDADGNEREVEIEIERDADSNSTRKIRFESEGRNESIEVESELEIDDDFEGNESELEAVASDGTRKRIRFLPEEARQRVRERLRVHADNVTNVSLEEVRHRNVPRVVYNIQANQNGRFLGIIKMALKSEVQVDPETGEVVEVNKPWWSFLVNVDEDDSEKLNESETNNTN